MTVAGTARWRVKPPDQLVWREVASEVVILDLRTSMYWTLNGSAAVLWLTLAEGATAEQLAERLVETYGIEAEVAARDVSAFLGSCHAQDLLEEA
jgi:hypothetical protein